MATAGHAADDKPHRVAIHVDQDDPAVMNLALNNAENVIEYYRGRGEDVDVETKIPDEMDIIFNSWSRTQRNTPRPTAGDSPTSRAANPATRRCTRPATRAT